jgi:hypothetical protein
LGLEKSAYTPTSVFPTMNVVESTAEYWSDFNEKVGEIQVLLDHDSVTPEHLLDIKSKISSLQTFATSNLEILPKYDVRRSQEVHQKTLVVVLIAIAMIRKLIS